MSDTKSPMADKSTSTSHKEEPPVDQELSSDTNNGKHQMEEELASTLDNAEASVKQEATSTARLDLDDSLTTSCRGSCQTDRDLITRREPFPPFPQFAKLPPEIRRKIWRVYALPKEPMTYYSRRPEQYEDSGLWDSEIHHSPDLFREVVGDESDADTLHSLTQVNYEARQEVLQGRTVRTLPKDAYMVYGTIDEETGFGSETRDFYFFKDGYDEFVPWMPPWLDGILPYCRTVEQREIILEDLERWLGPNHSVGP
ncbi:hypothetical protein F4780DRAFT_791896 [Xylariomycetidae sp. FL0641]|nr:hypothetical protein F4780DRAFT_791896 [Xylariomycetidae sp. FL0641]